MKRIAVRNVLRTGGRRFRPSSATEHVPEYRLGKVRKRRFFGAFECRSGIKKWKLLGIEILCNDSRVRGCF